MLDHTKAELLCGLSYEGFTAEDEASLAHGVLLALLYFDISKLRNDISNKLSCQSLQFI
ncbi:MAG: hypothetical protein LBC61_01900 [Candidatus Peribacteria bacterium]|nr:hypothetical protein [Candidatus Peribacteria bacterium]